MSRLSAYRRRIRQAYEQQHISDEHKQLITASYTLRDDEFAQLVSDYQHRHPLSDLEERLQRCVSTKEAAFLTRGFIEWHNQVENDESEVYALNCCYRTACKEASTISSFRDLTAIFESTREAQKICAAGLHPETTPELTRFLRAVRAFLPDLPPIARATQKAVYTQRSRESAPLALLKIHPALTQMMRDVPFPYGEVIGIDQGYALVGIPNKSTNTYVVPTMHLHLLNMENYTYVVLCNTYYKTIRDLE